VSIWESLRWSRGMASKNRRTAGTEVKVVVVRG
jgi:hypothetical protein